MKLTKTKTLAILALLALFAFLGRADEGMWMPHQMKDLNLKALGLQMNPDDLFKKDGSGLMSAVVNLGGGTGEFVSSEGLILTNHHVAYGAIQRASSKENDYIQNGFLAPGHEKEIQAQGYQAGVLLGYEDVTAKVNAYFKPKMTPRQRYDALDKAQKDLIAAGEKGGKDLRCTLASMYSGNAYYLYTFKQIRDIRLVYAPPQALGNFGGEVDNWMWPRHTCDFSFLRAYVAPDGTAADYSQANVPYKPKVWIKPSLDGYKEGDFTFVMGYPGRTYRNYAFGELKNDMDSMGQRIKDTQDLIAFYENAGKADKEVEIRYASRVKGLYNGLKNTQGKLEGLQKFDLIDRKAEQEKVLLDWIAADPARQAKYGKVVADLNAFLEKQKAFAARSAVLNGVLGGSTILGGAQTLVRAVEELQKPDQDPRRRLPGAQSPRTAPEHQPGRAGLRLRHRPGASEVDDQTAEGDPSGHRPVAAQPAGARGRLGRRRRRPDRRHVRRNQARRSPEAARGPDAASRPSSPPPTTRSSSWRRPWRRSSRSFARRARASAARAPTSRWATKPPSWR